MIKITHYPKQGFSQKEILVFIQSTDSMYDPPQSSIVNITDWSEKIYNNADLFVASNNGQTIGMIAAYMTQPPLCYITSVCVCKEYQNQGIFSSLYSLLEHIAFITGFVMIVLEVNKNNTKALSCYKRKGFTIKEEKDTSYIMEKLLN